VSYGWNPTEEAVTILEENNYYPYGLKHRNYNMTESDYKELFPSGIGIEPVDNRPYNYKYNGKEWQEDLGLNMYDMDLRDYDPAIARWVNIDPIVHYGQSTYNAFDGNPVVFADPSGGNSDDFIENAEGYNDDNNIIAPIYDPDGNFLGTDDEGLQGLAIVMNSGDFVQGMSHESAKSANLGKDGLSSFGAYLKLVVHYWGLRGRPDYDGYVTLSEANDWYRKGNGQPLFADLSKIGLSGICSLGKDHVGDVEAFNLFIVGDSFVDALVYGSITFKRYPDNQVRAYQDHYDFEQHGSPYNPIYWPRNDETLIGSWVAGQGNPFDINLFGSKTLEPCWPWTD